MFHGKGRCNWLFVIFIALTPSLFAADSTNKGRMSQAVSEIQNDLAWEGFYNGLADGVPGKGTLSAIIQFQKSLGEKANGALLQQQEDKLRFEASRTRAGYGWTQFIHPELGYSISYPGAILTRTEAIPNGGRQFYGKDKRFGLIVQVKSSSDSFRDRFHSQINQAEKVTYKRYMDDWFVVISESYYNRFYTRYNRLHNSDIGFTFMLPLEKSDQLEALTVAVAQSFKHPVDISWTKARVLQEKRLPGFNKAITSKIPASSNPIPVNISSKPKKQIGTENQLTKLSPIEIYRKSRDAVFLLLAVSDSNDEKPFQGSAVAVTENLLLTNCHVMEGKKYFLIKNGENTQLLSKIYLDKEQDMCALYSREQISKHFLPVSRKFEAIEVGEPVYAIGSPSGLDLTLSDGLVSSKRRDGQFRYVQTSAAISPGSSGGALIDQYGNLIGITSFQKVDAQNLNFAISIDDYKNALRRFSKK